MVMGLLEVRITAYLRVVPNQLLPSHAPWSLVYCTFPQVWSTAYQTYLMGLRYWAISAHCIIAPWSFLYPLSRKSVTNFVVLS